MLTYGAWSAEKIYDDRDVTWEISGGKLVVQFHDNRYTVLKCIQSVDGIRDQYFYRVHSRAQDGGLAYKLCYIWRDQDGNELEKGYMKDGARITALADYAKLELEVLLYGKGQGKFILDALEVTEEGPYQERRARLCAISYGMVGKPGPKTIQDNVNNVLQELDMISGQQPDLVVLTENVFQTGLVDYYNRKDNNSKLDDANVAQLCQKAKALHTYIACSLRTIDNEGVLHNTGILINREGTIQGTYNKTHLTIGEAEMGLPFDSDLPVFDTDFGKLGIMICWDHFFPEAVRLLALKGVEIIVVPTHGFRLERAVTRALENGVYLVSAYTLEQGTLVVDPNGNILDTAEGKGYALAEVDLNKPILVRWLSCNSYGNPNLYYMHERRPELYGSLMES